MLRAARHFRLRGGAILLLAALAAAQVPLADFAGVGDQVSIEGRQEMLRFFVAVLITVQEAAKDSR
jgi:hypothetical protein